MQAQWRDFLLDAGAEFIDERVASFGNPEREKRMSTQGGVLCDLSHLGLIAATGAEAGAFLQSQLTHDITQVDDRRSQLSAYLNPKGRMLALFRVFKRGDLYYLALPRELAEETLQRLRRFVLRAKVTLEDVSDALVHIGYSDPHAEAELTAALGCVPAEVDQAIEQSELTVIRVPGVQPRFEVFGELEAVNRLWSALNVHAAPVGAASWTLLEILAGVPSVFPETREAFIPQMCNLDLINGVSFTKGCYPGQEIVARTRYLGQVKRRMYRVHINTDAPLRPGTSLYRPVDAAVLADTADPAQSSTELSSHGMRAADAHPPSHERGLSNSPCGTIVIAAPAPDGGTEALAVISTEAVKFGGLLHIESSEGTAAYQGAPVTLNALPYAVPD